jgi:hypothetical protein
MPPHQGRRAPHYRTLPSARLKVSPRILSAQDCHNAGNRGEVCSEPNPGEAVMLRGNQFGAKLLLDELSGSAKFVPVCRMDLV